MARRSAFAPTPVILSGEHACSGPQGSTRRNLGRGWPSGLAGITGNEAHDLPLRWPAPSETRPEAPVVDGATQRLRPDTSHSERRARLFGAPGVYAKESGEEMAVRSRCHY